MNDHDHEALVGALRRIQNGFNNEAELQRAVGLTLLGALPAGAVLQTELVLTRADRIDFAVGRLGIECKCKGGDSGVHRQLIRYAAHFDALVLVTTKPFDYLATVPSILAGGRTVTLHLVNVWQNI